MNNPEKEVNMAAPDQAQPLLDQTRSHYDEYPFIEGGSNRIDWWRDYLVEFLPDGLVRGSRMVDVGSSVGEISRGLIDRGAQMTCVDISLGSLRRCREINPEAEIFHASALELPFEDASFDHAISIGVLHHTPDCRRGFHEVARVTAAGGTVVIFLYNYWSLYNLVFQAFKPLRAIWPLEKVPKWMVRTMQPFARTHLGQTLDDGQLRRLLGDKLWTPQATFHSVAEIKRWGAEEGLEFLKLKRFYLGYANVMSFRKRGDAPAGGTGETRLRCVGCGGSALESGSEVHRCTACGREYPLEGGIVRVHA